MNTKVGDFEFEINETNCKVDIIKGGKEVLSEIEFLLNYDKMVLNSENCDFSGVSEEENFDSESALLNVTHTKIKNNPRYIGFLHKGSFTS